MYVVIFFFPSFRVHTHACVAVRSCTCSKMCVHMRACICTVTHGPRRCSAMKIERLLRESTALLGSRDHVGIRRRSLDLRPHYLTLPAETRLAAETTGPTHLSNCIKRGRRPLPRRNLLGDITSLRFFNTPMFYYISRRYLDFQRRQSIRNL